MGLDKSVNEGRLYRLGVNLPEAAARAESLVTPCGPCRVRPLAICSALTGEEIQHLAAAVKSTHLVAGQSLFNEGDPATRVFVVTAGTLRLCKLLADGRRQVTGFLTVSDFLGLANGETYAYSAEAVSNASLCQFYKNELRALLDRFPQMERELFSEANNELAVAQEQMLVLGCKFAIERLSSFLLMLWEKAIRQGLPTDPLVLAMGRPDIGDYLGLSTETVSRTFSELRQEGVISLDSPARVRMLDIDRLRDIAAGLR